jgi:hypothetical protein
LRVPSFEILLGDDLGPGEREMPRQLARKSFETLNMSSKSETPRT